MNVSDILKPSLVKIDLASTTKDELFEEMVGLFVANDLIQDPASALSALREREAKMTTGVSKWLGLPHGRLQEVTELLMAVGVSRRGIDYDAMDGEPVYVVFMVFAQIGNPGSHIQALARISRILSGPGVIERLRAAVSGEAVVRILRAQEE